MITARHTSQALLGAALLLLANACRDEVEAPPELRSLAELPPLMDFFEVPGVSIAIIRNFQIDALHVFGVADGESGRALDVDTRFQAGSISKSLAAVVALKLVQEGKLALDGDINDVLTSWTLRDESGEPRGVSLRQLLSHRAGTTVHGFLGYARSAPLPTLTQVLDGMPPANSAPVRVDHEPGTQSRYSGGGYVVVQQALVDRTGMPFQELAAQTVFAPLQMVRSTFRQPLPEEELATASAAHDARGAPLPSHSFVHPELTAAGLWTTPRELAMFLIEMMNALRGNSERVLSQQTAVTMLTAASDAAYGLGFALSSPAPDAYFGHGGANRGFRLNMIAHRQAGVGAVVMTNGERGDAVIRAVLATIAREQSWPAGGPTQVDAGAAAPMR